MTITCVGDCGIDDYIDDNLKRPGGITLNFAVHAKKLFPSNDTIEIITALGDKKDSKTVLSTIKKYDIPHIIEERSGTAPVQYIKRSSSGEKQFAGYDEGVLGNFIISQRQKEHIIDSDFLIMPLYEQIQTFFDSVFPIKTKGIVSIDFMDLTDYGKKITVVEKYLDTFDIAFFGLSVSETSLLSDLKHLSRDSTKLFVVTLGENGSVILKDGNEIAEQTTPLEKVIDTTGAGDAFAAAFTKNYLYNQPLPVCLKEANIYAKQIIQQLGTF